jgi:hypothetical protein
MIMSAALLVTKTVTERASGPSASRTGPCRTTTGLMCTVEIRCTPPLQGSDPLADTTVQCTDKLRSHVEARAVAIYIPVADADSPALEKNAGRHRTTRGWCSSNGGLGALRAHTRVLWQHTADGQDGHAAIATPRTSKRPSIL